jgi:hypothetical protein
MKKILFAFGLCCATGAFSQNGYYDVLALVKWSRMPDTAVRKIEQAEGMLVKLLKYSPGGHSSPFKQWTYRHIGAIYRKADSLYSFKERFSIPREEVIAVMEARGNRNALPVDVTKPLAELAQVKREVSRLEGQLTGYRERLQAARKTRNGTVVRDAVRNFLLTSNRTRFLRERTRSLRQSYPAYQPPT